MTNFILLTKAHSLEEDHILINPVLIESIENRTFNGKIYSEIGLMSGKSHEVREKAKEIIQKIEEAARFKMTSK